jgi:hypothetical protein
MDPMAHEAVEYFMFDDWPAVLFVCQRPRQEDL